EDRQAENRIFPEVLVVLNADEGTVAAYARVGEAQPYTQTERISQEDEQQYCRRQHEPEREEATAFCQPLHQRRIGGIDGNGIGGHGLLGSSIFSFAKGTGYANEKACKWTRSA